MDERTPTSDGFAMPPEWAPHQATRPELWGVEPLELPIDDSSLRDSGPVFVANGRGELALVQFGFNAWGEMCNGAATVPVAGVPDDQRALAELRALWPDRQIVPVPGTVRSFGGGGPHCITQQVPAGSFVT